MSISDCEFNRPEYFANVTVAQFISKAEELPFDERILLAHSLWDEIMDGFNGWKAPPLPDGDFAWKRLKLEIDAELNRSDRIELAQLVWQNVTENGYDPEPTPEQMAELDRRLEDLEKNPEVGIPWEQVQAEMKARFGWK